MPCKHNVKTYSNREGNLWGINILVQWNRKAYNNNFMGKCTEIDMAVWLLCKWGQVGNRGRVSYTDKQDIEGCWYQ